MITISVARDFSPYPAGRFRKDGRFSGEVFRQEVLERAFKEYQKVVIELDGVRGYSNSFLEEAFGGLIRTSGYTLNVLREKLSLKTDDTSLYDEIQQYLKDAAQDKS